MCELTHTHTLNTLLLGLLQIPGLLSALRVALTVSRLKQAGTTKVLTAPATFCQGTETSQGLRCRDPDSRPGLALAACKPMQDNFHSP